MQDPVYIIGMLILLGLVFALLGLPLKYEKIPPNWFYGFRTRKTLSSKEIWYPVNRVAGIDMVRTGIVMVVTGVIMLSLRNFIGTEAAVIIFLSVTAGMTLWMLIHGFSVLRRL